MFVPVVSMTRSTLMVVGKCAWATPNPVISISLNHPRLVVVHGTTTIACCGNSSNSSEVTTIAGRTKPGSPRAGVPKSQRTTSPARISDIARRRIEHSRVFSIERSARELSPEYTTTFPPDQLLELSVKGETLTIGELPQRITGPHRNLDGSRLTHTPEYTSISQRWGLRDRFGLTD